MEFFLEAICRTSQNHYDNDGWPSQRCQVRSICLETYTPTFLTHISALGACVSNLSLRKTIPPPQVLCLTLREYNERKRACVGSFIAQARRWTLPVCLAVWLFVWLSDCLCMWPFLTSTLIMCWIKLSLIVMSIASRNFRKYLKITLDQTVLNVHLRSLHRERLN